MTEEPQDPETIKLSYTNEQRITHDTFCKLFDDHSRFDNFTVVDCRTEREYDGGHIKGAIRCHPFENPSNVPDLYQKIYKPRSIYIFHCEYSAYRGPTAWAMFTEAHQNSPNAQEPLHAFILDGGYREFYPLHPDYCDGKYVPEGFGWFYDY